MQLVTAAYSTGGITHPKIIITPAFIQDFRCRTRLGRKSRKSKVKDKYKSKSRVKLNISLVKSLTAVADRPTVYVRVTPPCMCGETRIPREMCAGNTHPWFARSSGCLR